MEERAKLLAASLILVSKEKQKRLEVIKNLTLAQTAVAKQEDTDDLLENMVQLINEKQRKMEEISLLDENFNKLYSELDDLIGIGKWQNAKEHPHNQLRELYLILEKNISILREVQSIDIQNTNKMQQNLAQIQQELRKIKQGKKFALGYESTYGGVDSYFVDKKR